MALKFRRGTTAQKSGSLAFGEPYVNTTLGTLQIGGDTGDITLASSTGGGYATTGSNSFNGDQTITGSLNVSGNATIGGQLQIGDQTSDTVNVVASLSSSLIPQTSNAFDLGSASKIWRDLYISTGSIKIINPGTGTVVGTISSNASGDLITSGALIVSSGSNPELRLVNGTTGMEWHMIGYDTDSLSIHNSRTNRSTFRIDSGSTGFHSHFFGDVNVLTGSMVTQRVSASFGITGSISATNGVVSGSSQVIGILSSLNAFSSSQLTQNSTLATLTGSNAVRLTNLESTTASLSQRVAANEAVSGTYARTNSTNTFTGTQTISGSLFVTSDLIVQGSSSIQNISSSNVVIGASYVTLNTFSPASRYAGFNFIDSGSVTGRSGSLFYDSVDDEIIFVHKGNGANVTSSHVVMGPETYDNLGNETYMTTNRIPKVLNFEHIGDSNITDNGSVVSINSTTQITGSLQVTAGITGSLNGYATAVYTPGGTAKQILYQSAGGAGSTTTSDTNLQWDSATSKLSATNVAIPTTGTLQSSLDGTNNISMHDGTFGKITIRNNSVDSITIWRGGAINLSGSVTATTGFTGSLSGNATTATTLQTARTINGTSFDGSANITIQNLVSGSSQITPLLPAGTISGSIQVDATATTNWATGIKTRLDANTVISGSGQVAISSTSGYGSVLNQAVLTSSSPTFAGLTINGAITATGDITAYYSSDKRFKSNIQLIPNALEKVSKLNGVTWTWNEDVNEVTKTTPNTGLIAQEVQEVLPEVVMEREDGHLGLDYSKMMGLLVEAIKEQQTKIHSLTLEVEKLKESKGL